MTCMPEKFKVLGSLSWHRPDAGTLFWSAHVQEKALESLGPGLRLGPCAR